MKQNFEHQKELSWANLHLFLNLVRKSGHDLIISTSISGVEYKLNGNFNNENWSKTLRAAKESGEASDNEVEKFESLMDGILHLL